MKLSMADTRLQDAYVNRHQVFFEELFKRQDELESKQMFQGNRDFERRLRFHHG